MLAFDLCLIWDFLLSCVWPTWQNNTIPFIYRILLQILKVVFCFCNLKWAHMNWTDVCVVAWGTNLDLQCSAVLISCWKKVNTLQAGDLSKFNKTDAGKCSRRFLSISHSELIIFNCKRQIPSTNDHCVHFYKTIVIRWIQVSRHVWSEHRRCPRLDRLLGHVDWWVGLLAITLATGNGFAKCEN